MRDRLGVGGAVAVLDEEALVVFEPVGRSHDGVVQPVGVIIFELLAGALLHVGRGNHAEIGIERHAVLLRAAVGRLGDQIGEVVALAGKRVGDRHLAAPAFTEFRHELADEGVAPLVAARGGERRGDVFGNQFDAEPLGDHPAETQALPVGVALGHEQRQHPLAAEGMHGERRRHARIDAAGKADDGTAAAEIPQHLGAQDAGDPLDLGRRVEFQRLGGKDRARLQRRQRHGVASSISASIRRRLILPLSVLGRSSRNSICFGTMKSSRCLAQWRMTSCSLSSRLGRQRDHRLDRHAEDRVGHADHGRLADAGKRVEDVLDLFRRDLLAARLDDVVLAPDEIEEAILVAAEDVPGMEDFLARHRSRPEHRVGGGLVLPVALHHMRAANHQFAGDVSPTRAPLSSTT